MVVMVLRWYDTLKKAKSSKFYLKFFMPRKVRISLGINATVSFFMKILFFVQDLLVFETRSLVARGNGFVYVLFTVKKQSRKGCFPSENDRCVTKDFLLTHT